MVIKDCILKGSEILRASGVDNPMLDARVLLCYVLDKGDVYVIINPDTEVDNQDEDKFFSLVSRRACHEPIAYIINEKEFMSLNFYVDKNVLIPRPDTEHLAELAIKLIKDRGFKKAADFCTGSGALAISVAKGCPDVYITGYDISLPALTVANKNKERIGADNASFCKLDVLNDLPVMGERYDIVISNPPYISGKDMKALDKTVGEYEPHLALFGGQDGLEFYRIITENAAHFLNIGGVLAFEVGHTQAADVERLMKNAFDDIQINKDYAGIERVVYGILK